MRLYTTSDLSAMGANLLRRSFTANLMRLEPNGMCPIFAFTGLAHERIIRAVTHSFYAKQFQIPTVVTSGAHVAGDTTITLTGNADRLRAGSVLMVYKITAGTYVAPEYIRVTDIPSATTLTVTRGFAGTTPGAITSGAVLVEISSAFEEGSNAPDSRSIAMAEYKNEMQTFRDKWDVTRTASRVQLEPNVEVVANNKEDAMFYHGANIEQTMIFGRKSVGVLNGKPFRTMDGFERLINNLAPGNIRVAGATTTFDQLEDMVHPTLGLSVNGRKSNMRTIYAGAHAFDTIGKIGRKSGYFELEPDNNIFGTQFRRFRTTRATCELVEHPILSASADTSKMAIILDHASWDLLYLDKTFHKDIAFNGTDATSGVYTTECTLEMQGPTNCGIIYNLTAAA